MEAAKVGNAKIMFSATVCGGSFHRNFLMEGLPVVNVGRNMIAAHITKFQGVFNATTNFILGIFNYLVQLNFKAKWPKIDLTVKL